MDSVRSEIANKKETENKSPVITGTRSAGDSFDGRFLFKRTTDLANIFEYMDDIRRSIKAKSRGLCSRLETLKNLEGLKLSLTILQNARKYGFDPCVTCLNKQYCSAVCALLSGEERAEIGFDDDCVLSEKCQISDKELQVVMETIDSFIIIIRENSNRRWLLKKIDNLLSEKTGECFEKR